MEFIVHLLVTTVLLLVVARIVPGIEVRDTGSAVVAALLLGLANAFVRPVIVILTLPITILTLGLFLWVVNALMLMLTAGFVDGFRVKGLGSALIGSLVLGVLNLSVAMLFGI